MKLISNATVFCSTQGMIKGGNILFDEKKIHAVVKSLSIPKGVKRFNVRGKYGSPGFIDAHRHHGIFDGSIGWTGEDGNEKTSACTPEVRGNDALNPLETSLKDLLESIVKVIKKELPIHAHAHRADDISTIIRIADEFNFKIIFIGKTHVATTTI